MAAVTGARYHTRFMRRVKRSARIALRPPAVIIVNTRAPWDPEVMESERTRERIDVMIGGGGFAGLALAIALRQGLGPSFSVTVADPALARAAADGRASAIVAAARRLFEVIGVWHQVEAQPILDMVVSDSRLHDVVRPTFLTFEGDLEPGEPFAHMIENGPLLAAL